MEFIEFLAPPTIPLRVQFNLAVIMALVGLLRLFILVVINNVPVPTVQAEVRCQNLLD